MIPFTESKFLQVFRKEDLESNDKFFQAILKTSASSKTLTTPIPSKLFINPIRSVVSLSIQILYLDNDSMVTEVMLGTFLYLSQFEAVIKFEKFLARGINSQLGKFHLDKHFKYQVYVFSIIVSSNRKSLEGMEPYVFKEWP